MTSDPIADFLVRIKNAGAAGHSSTSVPFSRIKFEIASLLEKEGFVGLVERKGKKSRKFLEVGLKYDEDGRAAIEEVVRLSKPGRRMYFKVSDISPVKSGYGLLVLSTPKGLMTGATAKKSKIGGEALFKIW